mmetsp:Transcript_120064/g.346845  ORF Transcript_120064/g.346845 Transcript_120064/m.346845 type:complete len:110 (-) Transcript_120064:126-455(-)
MANQFFQRVANYVANEIIIKGLANSRTFQRLAVRTNKQYEDFTKQGADQLNQTLEELAKKQAGEVRHASTAASAAVSSTITGPPKPPLRGIPGFFVAFFKEIRRDVTGA